MRKHEIQRKFDEIVDFSGCERYIDTPVKRYSSGMYVRLAFAVAAHLESEILILDEVLAVGDSEFQKKCLGKMKDVSRGGRTVLFVSHNLQAVKSLCTKAILLQAGILLRDDSTSNVLDFYSQTGIPKDTCWIRKENKQVVGLVFSEIKIQLHGKQPDLKLKISADLQGDMKHKAAFLAYDILDSSGVSIMQAIPEPSGFIKPESVQHQVLTTVELPPMIPGLYSITAWVGSHNTETLDIVSECVMFEIENSPNVGRSFPHTSDHGYIVPKSSIETNL
jgi:lipopolysaccharide transport system ATP-binding protein